MFYTERKGAETMKTRWKEFPLTVEEVRELMRKDDRKKGAWIAVAIGVVAVLVAIVIWIAKKREKDLEEHYEYFDDDFDELDENYEEFDESIYEDDDDDIEYVKIKDFMNYAEDEKTDSVEKTSEAKEEE